MLNNEQDYPGPREFRPERFLTSGELDSSVRDPRDIAFGFGRRWASSILSTATSIIIIIIILLEFVLDSTSLTQLLRSQLRLFWQRSTC